MAKEGSLELLRGGDLKELAARAVVLQLLSIQAATALYSCVRVYMCTHF